MPELMRYSANHAVYPDEWSRHRKRVCRHVGSRESIDSWKSGYKVTYPKLLIRLVSDPAPRPILEDSFSQLVKTWRRETAIHSSILKKVTHPAYLRIIGMGPDAIPLILKEMKRRPGHWFCALDAVTQGDSPVQDWQNLEQATQAWIKWGETKGYL